jgi:hypothetical protein
MTETFSDTLIVLPWTTLALLFAAGFAAGIVDSMAGGGGLITVPALLLAGLPPVHALGTNKLQGLFGSGSATLAYARNGHVDLRAQFWPALWSGLGAAAGAALAAVLPSGWLDVVLPVMLIAIALYFTFKPNLDDSDRHRRMAPALFSATIVPAIGFYDGLFGPGTGSFFMLAFVSLAGYGVLKATAHTKLLNFASNIGALAAFAFAGVIFWQIGVLMGIGQFLGAQIGARLAMKNGARLIKPLLVGVCILLALRLLLT